MNDIEIQYQIDDGYAGGSRPQYVSVAVDDFNDCATDDEIREKLIDFAHEDMLELVQATVDDLDGLVEAVKAARDVNKQASQ